MRKCRNGHELRARNVVLIGKAQTKRCRRCIEDHKRSLRIKNKAPIKTRGVFEHEHTPECIWTTRSDGIRWCVTRKRWYDAVHTGRVRTEDMVDGLEDEYGPVPPPALNEEWYDEVIVARALVGFKTGRAPTPKEAQEIVRRMTNQSSSQIADWCGVDIRTVDAWRSRYGSPVAA